MGNAREWTLRAAGIPCDHCARSVHDAVRQVPGVAEVATDHRTGTRRLFAEENVEGPTPGDAIREEGCGVADQTVRSPRWKGPRQEEGEIDLLVIDGGSAGFPAAIFPRTWHGCPAAPDDLQEVFR